MTARYELRRVGVYDRETGIDLRRGDEKWPTYEAWLAVPGNVPDPMPPEPVPTLEFLRAEKLAAIEATAAEQRSTVTRPSSPSEMASWYLKLQQARAYQATPLDTAAPMLALEAQTRGVPTADVVNRVIANADAFSKAEARIAGVSGRHRDALRAFATAAQVRAYDDMADWPFLPPPPPTNI